MLNLDDQTAPPSSESSALSHSAQLQAARILAALPWIFLTLVAVAFLPSLGFAFVNWDDDLHVLANPAVLGTGGARDLWLTPSLGYVIPVTVASYRLEYLIVGDSPWPYHATNLLLHLCVCGLLYRIGRRLGLGKVGASFALLVFGLHPVVAEPVSWISGRKDLLATLFGLATSWAFLGSTDPPQRRWRAAMLGTALFSLAALSKPSVLALPFLWVLSRSERSGRSMVMALPSMLVAAAMACLSWLGQSRAGALHAFASPLVWAREILYSLGYHLGLACFVQQPLAKHIPARMPPSFDPAVDILPIGLGLLLWLGLRRMDERLGRVARFGLLFAALAFLPSSSVAPLKRFLADSYVYLPLAGVAWLAGAGVETLLPRLRPAWRWAAGLATTVVLLLACSTTSAAWSNSVTLWKPVYQRYPDSPQVCLNYGNAYFERGQVETALGIYDHCTSEFGPDHFAKNRAIALFMVGRRQESRALFQKLRTQYPNDLVIRKYLAFLDGQ
jgi:protein O-mannosyl-transferase